MKVEKRLAKCQDIQMVAEAVLKKMNESEFRLVRVNVEKKYDDFFELEMVFDYNVTTTKVDQKIVVGMIEKGKSLVYADSRKDAYSYEGYRMTVLTISTSRYDSTRDFVLIVFEK